MQVPTTAWQRDEAGDVRSGEELNLDALRGYLSKHLPLRGELTVRQFPSGFSNLTYLLGCGDEQWVLRRPPFGTKARTAHDMGREYRVLSALHKVFPYAPEPVLLCADENVLGASWYLMRHVPGLIIRRDYPAGLALLPAQVRTQFERCANCTRWTTRASAWAISAVLQATFAARWRAGASAIPPR
jgi:aminoglycoside phosphotransferase (APT) family kinase protein